MRGRRVGLLTAVGAALLVAGIALGFAQAQQRGSAPQALQAGKLLAPETAVSHETGSSRIAGFARPHLSRPLRSIEPGAPVRHAKQPGNGFEQGYPLRFPHGTSKPGDGALQTSPGSGQSRTQHWSRTIGVMLAR